MLLFFGEVDLLAFARGSYFVARVNVCVCGSFLTGLVPKVLGGHTPAEDERI